MKVEVRSKGAQMSFNIYTLGVKPMLRLEGKQATQVLISNDPPVKYIFDPVTTDGISESSFYVNQDVIKIPLHGFWEVSYQITFVPQDTCSAPVMLECNFGTPSYGYWIRGDSIHTQDGQNVNVYSIHSSGIFWGDPNEEYNLWLDVTGTDSCMFHVRDWSYGGEYIEKSANMISLRFLSPGE